MLNEKATRDQVASNLLDFLGNRRPDLSRAIEQVRDELTSGAPPSTDKPLFLVSMPGEEKTKAVKDAIKAVGEQLGLRVLDSAHSLDRLDPQEIDPNNTLVFMTREGQDASRLGPLIGPVESVMATLDKRRKERAHNMLAVVELIGFEEHQLDSTDVGLELLAPAHNELRIGSVSTALPQQEATARIRSGLAKAGLKPSAIRVEGFQTKLFDFAEEEALDRAKTLETGATGSLNDLGKALLTRRAQENQDAPQAPGPKTAAPN